MSRQYQNYFRNQYGAYFTARDIDTYRKWFLPQWKLLNTHVCITSSDSLLEIGSGLGGLYSFLPCKKGYRGIELDPEAVEFTNQYFHTKSFLHQSFEDMAEEQQFGYIAAFEVLEHLYDPISVIEKMSRMLHPRGVFIGTTPYPFRKNVLADLTHTFVLHPLQWKRLLLQHGFREVSVYPMSFFPFFWRIHAWFNIRIPFYVPFKYFISTTLIIARK